MQRSYQTFAVGEAAVGRGKTLLHFIPAPPGLSLEHGSDEHREWFIYGYEAPPGFGVLLTASTAAPKFSFSSRILIIEIVGGVLGHHSENPQDERQTDTQHFRSYPIPLLDPRAGVFKCKSRDGRRDIGGKVSGYCIQCEAFVNPKKSMERIFRPLESRLRRLPNLAKPLI